MVRLEKADIDVLALAGAADQGKQVGIALFAVNLRLAQTQKVQVRSVDDKYFHCKLSSIRSAVCSTEPLLSMTRSAKRS